MTDLAGLTVELEAHVATGGWDQAPRLFALVRTGSLLASEPQLAPELAALDPDGLTPVEQEPVDGDLLELLPAIAWPSDVAGCALVNEVLMLPGGLELPDDMAPEDHPERREVRIAMAVLRGGTETATLRVRGVGDAEDDLVTAPGLLPNLSAALLDTLAEPVDD